MCDWVYEEEFSLRAFEMVSDSKKIAFLRFDESNVKEYTMEYYRDDVYPIPYLFKYLRSVKITLRSAKIYNLDNQRFVSLDKIRIKYIVRESNGLKTPTNYVFFKMNRHQNHLQNL